MCAESVALLILQKRNDHYRSCVRYVEDKNDWYKCHQFGIVLHAYQFLPNLRGLIWDFRHTNSIWRMKQTVLKIGLGDRYIYQTESLLASFR
jgi:hypothetical protein